MTSSLKCAIAGIRRASTSNSAKSAKSTKAASKRKPVRRALIIGIVYRNTEGEALISPHKDALAWRGILIKNYGYHEGDITMMLDDEETLRDPARSHLVPLKDNILRELKALVNKARSGDRFMFYYAGHGTQIESDSTDEEDGFDEAIVPYSPNSDAELILDNTLRELLVEPLPPGAALTAIFDSCCSGTLLDLEHYACNNVYFPWVNRGKRDLRSVKRALLRCKNDDFLQVKVELNRCDQTSVTDTDDTHSHAPTKQHGCLRICERTRSKSDAIIKRDRVINDNGSDKTAGARFVVRSSTLQVPRHRDSHIEKRRPRRVFSIPHKFSFKAFFRKPPQYAEPESYLSCDGFNCRPEETQTRPHVITISACQDPEQTWDSKKGFTLTRAMIKVLDRCPNMPVRRLVERVGHGMYRTTLKLHRLSQKELKEWRANHSAQEDLGRQLEIFNSPMPQLGSTNVLSEHEPFRA